MIFKKVGNTNIKVSALSLGTWSLGGETKGKTSYGKISKRNSSNIISKAYDLGVNFYDTSPTYGFSQSLLGSCFKKKRDKVVLSSKVGLNSYTHKKNFSEKFITKQIHKILLDLKTDYIDFIKLYCPNPKDKSLIDGYEALIKLKKKGLIRHVGVSLNSPDDLLSFNKDLKFEIIQCNLNLLDLRILNKKTINHIKKENIGIIARTIYCFGIFTEKFLNPKNFHSLKFRNKNDHRNRWNNEQFNLWIKGAKVIKKKLNKDLKIEDIATRFPNSFDFVSSSLMGVQSTNELINNMNKKNFYKLNEKMIESIINVNKQKFFISNKSPKRVIK